MEDIITLQNGSDVPQHVYDDEGRRHTLHPHQAIPVPASIATLFLRERGQYVTVWKPVQVPAGVPGEPTVYVANVTGSPFLSEEIEHKYLDKQTKLEVIKKIPNPLRVPFPVLRKYPQPQKVIDTPGGTKTTLSSPPLQVSIPPWNRVAVPKSCGDWLLRRDVQQDDKMIGALVQARAPSAFEPNESWPLHEIMVYARMVDDDAQNWVQERDVWEAIEKNDHTSIANLKIKLLQTLFHRVIDERWALPTREQFQKQLAIVLDEHTSGAPQVSTKKSRGASNASAST